MTFHIYVNRKLFMFYIMSKYNYERAGAFGSLCISNDPFAPPPEPYFSPNCMYTEAFSGSYGSRTTQMSVLGFNIMGILNLDQNPDTIDWSIVINSNIWSRFSFIVFQIKIIYKIIYNKKMIIKIQKFP